MSILNQDNDIVQRLYEDECVISHCIPNESEAKTIGELYYYNIKKKVLTGIEACYYAQYYGNLYIHKGKKSLAIKMGFYAIQASNNNMWYGMVLAGISYIYIKQYQKALDFLLKALTTANKDNGVVLNILGYAQYKLGHTDEAIDFLKKSAKMGYVDAYVNLGHIYIQRKNFSKALECFATSKDREETLKCFEHMNDEEIFEYILKK